MPPQYVTVYQIAQRTPNWPFVCIGLVPFIAGAVILWGKRRFKWTQPHWLFAIFCCLFGVLWVSITAPITLLANSNAFTAYQKGDYQIVEGVVTDFQPMPYEGHQNECFSVQEQRFCYSDYEITPGFHNAVSHGGPIRAGLPVRIAYRNDLILRLDVPKDQALTPAQSAAVTKESERQWQQRTENDPFLQKMTTAFLFTAMCWTLWWNLQWKRVMRFWLKPPYLPWVQVLFRVFFALNFLGALIGFVRQLFSHPLTKQDIIPTVRIAAIMCAIVAAMSAFVLWQAQRRDRPRSDGMAP
jgi:hypothetical protein